LEESGAHVREILLQEHTFIYLKTRNWISMQSRKMMILSPVRRDHCFSARLRRTSLLWNAQKFPLGRETMSKKTMRRGIGILRNCREICGSAERLLDKEDTT
jgi:hypothetical protein